MDKLETVNRWGVTVKHGDYWTMDSPANEFYPDETWLMQVDYISPTNIVTVNYVNWKKKGEGRNFSRMVDDFGRGGLRPSTDEEIKYFKSRNKLHLHK